MYKTVRDYDHKKEQQEDYTGIQSQTVPNQSLSVKDLVKRYTRGQEVDALPADWADLDVIEQYQDEIDSVSGLDKFQRKDLARENAKLIKDLTEKISKAKSLADLKRKVTPKVDNIKENSDIKASEGDED